MSKKQKSSSDLNGASRLGIDAVNGIIDIVEAVHYNITSMGGLLRKNRNQRTSGITGLVYRNIRSVTGLAGKGLESVLDRFPAVIDSDNLSHEQEALRSVLNGVIGDHLENTQNPLCIEMKLRMDGKEIHSFQQLSAKAHKRILLMVHGSCMNDLQWMRKGHNHGDELAKELNCQVIYLHYNTGRHISINGQYLSGLLEDLSKNFADDTELLVLAHSMGGLVTRSAYEYGMRQNCEWLKHLKKIVFLGTPHHGAPLEQIGNWIDNILQTNAFSAPIARLGKIRSAGITDLRFGNILDEDWNQQGRFEPSGDRRVLVPLPKEVDCYTIAGAIYRQSSKIGDDLIGDGLVPLNSALGKHKINKRSLLFPKEHQLVVRGVKHLDLLNHIEVFLKIKEWLITNRV